MDSLSSNCCRFDSNMVSKQTVGDIGMSDVTTIQVFKTTLEALNKKKLQYQAQIGKTISLDEYIRELIK